MMSFVSAQSGICNVRLVDFSLQGFLSCVVIAFCLCWQADVFLFNLFSKPGAKGLHICYVFNANKCDVGEQTSMMGSGKTSGADTDVNYTK